jgi:hypothetical protein
MGFLKTMEKGSSSHRSKRFRMTPDRLHKYAKCELQLQKYKEGQRVIAEWRTFDYPNWYPAKITRVHDDGKLNLDFKDGKSSVRKKNNTRLL